jgi:hypothetical protein
MFDGTTFSAVCTVRVRSTVTRPQTFYFLFGAPKT